MTGAKKCSKHQGKDFFFTLCDITKGSEQSKKQTYFTVVFHMLWDNVFDTVRKKTAVKVSAPCSYGGKVKFMLAANF